MKKIVLIFILITSVVLTSFTFLHAAPLKIEGISCEKSLEPLVEKVQELPQVRELMEKCLEDGPIRIKINRHMSKDFDGFWDGSNRTVYITKRKNTNETTMISTLIFELHNALRDKDLVRCDRQAARRAISKKDYVRKVERIEFENIQAAAEILNEGRKAGLWPKDPYWNYSNDFEEHLNIQKRSGHSNWIAQNY